MGFLEDFWDNINNPKLASSPDPVMNISKAPTGFITADSWNWGTSNSGLGTTITSPTDPANSGGNTPANSNAFNQEQTYGYIESYHGDDIALLHQHAIDLGTAQRDAKAHRDSVEAKVKSQKTEIGILHQKHIDQEGRISEKAGLDHTHANGGIEWYVKLAIIAVVGIGAFFLIKKRLFK
jgi:hypothetical protein